MERFAGNFRATSNPWSHFQGKVFCAQVMYKQEPFRESQSRYQLYALTRAAISFTNILLASTAFSLPLLLESWLKACTDFTSTSDGRASLKHAECFSHRADRGCWSNQKPAFVVAEIRAHVLSTSSSALEFFDTKEIIHTAVFCAFTELSSFSSNLLASWRVVSLDGYEEYC